MDGDAPRTLIGRHVRISTDRILKIAEDEGLTKCLTQFLDRLVTFGVFAKQDIEVETQMIWIRGLARTMRKDFDEKARSSDPISIRVLRGGEIVSVCSDCGAQGSCSRTVLESSAGSCTRTLCSACIRKRREQETEITFDEQGHSVIGQDITV